MKLLLFVLQLAMLGLAGCRSVPARHSEAIGPVQASGPAEANDFAPAPVVFGAPSAMDIAADAAASEVRLAAHENDGPWPALPSQPALEGLPTPTPGGTLAPHQLTLADLESMALSQNPAVGEAAARVQALRGRQLQVGLPPNPSIGYTASEVGNDGRGGQQGGFVGQEFVTGNKLGLNQMVVAAELQKAQQDLAAFEQRVLTDVRLGYYELLIAQERLETAERLANISRQAVEAVEQLLAVQEVPRTDLLQAQIELDTAQILVDNARAARLGAWQRLSAILGSPDMPLSEVAGEAATDLPLIEFDAAVERLITQSPELGAAIAEIERARRAVGRARAEVVPNVTLQATVQYDDSTDFTVAGVQAGLPLPIINRNQGGIQEAQGELVAAQRAAERLGLALYRRLAAVFQQYAMARQQADRYARDVLPKVDETLRLTTAGYQAGEFNFLQLLTAQRTYFQTNLAYLDALGQLWQSSRQIEGLLLSDSLETGPVVE